MRELPAGCIVRVAVGWKSGAQFASIAHSPALEIPPGEPSPIHAEALVRWTPRGAEPVRPGDADAASIERALARVRRDAARARHGYLGASEQWAMAAPT